MVIGLVVICLSSRSLHVFRWVDKISVTSCCEPLPRITLQWTAADRGKFWCSLAAALQCNNREQSIAATSYQQWEEGAKFCLFVGRFQRPDTDSTVAEFVRSLFTNWFRCNILITDSLSLIFHSFRYRFIKIRCNFLPGALGFSWYAAGLHKF